MDFKLVSKNNMGIVITLILVVLLSQSRFFDFYMESYLGRMFLLVFVIFVAYANKFLGLLAVLFIMIGFNQYDMNVVQSYNYYEGFDGSGNIPNLTEEQKAKAKKVATDININSDSNSNMSQTTTTTSSVVSGKVSTTGIEGFCMTDRELNILRGKQSNSVPVYNSKNVDDDVSPTDKSVFSNLFASF